MGVLCVGSSEATSGDGVWHAFAVHCLCKRSFLGSSERGRPLSTSCCGQGRTVLVWWIRVSIRRGLQCLHTAVALWTSPRLLIRWDLWVPPTKTEENSFSTEFCFLELHVPWHFKGHFGKWCMKWKRKIICVVSHKGHAKLENDSDVMWKNSYFSFKKSKT